MPHRERQITGNASLLDGLTVLVGHLEYKGPGRVCFAVGVQVDHFACKAARSHDCIMPRKPAHFSLGRATSAQETLNCTINGGGCGSDSPPAPLYQPLLPLLARPSPPPLPLPLFDTCNSILPHTSCSLPACAPRLPHYYACPAHVFFALPRGVYRSRSFACSSA